MKKKLLLLVILMVIFSSFINTGKIEVTRVEYKVGNNTPTEEEALNALKATAYAYYYRGNTIQYSDETYFPDKNFYARPAAQSFYTPPEYATYQNNLNLHCMSFVYLVYNQTFKNKTTGEGYKLGDITAKNASTISVMTDIANKTSGHGKEITVFYKAFDTPGGAINEKNTVSSILKPGDIIVYREKYYSNGAFTTKKTGHAMLYLGDNKVINVSQTVNGYYAKKYQFLNKIDTTTWSEQKLSTINPNGAVGFVDLNRNVLNYHENEINKYIFKTSISELAVFRPFNFITKNDSEYTLSDSANVRVNYPDLVINKTASVNKYDNVYLGEEITYTIKLENKSTTIDYSNISITDKVPTNTDFVSIKDGTNNSGNLSWTLNLGKGETKEVSYTVKVKSNENIIGSSIISNNTKVDGMSINNIENKIKGKFDKSVYDKIIEISNNKVGKTVEDSNIAETIYNELTNGKFTEFNNRTADNYLNSLYHISNVNLQELNLVGERFGSGTKNTYTLKEEVTSMYVKDLFGGSFTKGILDNDAEDQRYFRINNDTLTIGDILIVHDEDYQVDNYVAGEKNMYLYIGNGEFVTIDPTTNKVIKLDEKANEKLTVYENGTSREITQQTNRSRLIESLAGQNTFIVLRPSNIMSKNLIDEVNDKYKITEVSLPNTSSKIGILMYIVGGILVILGSMILIKNHTKKAI